MHPLRWRASRSGAPVIAAVATRRPNAERRMRQRRAVKIVLLVASAVIWVPIAIIMLAASVSDRRA